MVVGVYVVTRVTDALRPPFHQYGSSHMPHMENNPLYRPSNIGINPQRYLLVPTL